MSLRTKDDYIDALLSDFTPAEASDIKEDLFCAFPGIRQSFDDKLPAVMEMTSAYVATSLELEVWRNALKKANATATTLNAAQAKLQSNHGHFREP